MKTASLSCLTLIAIGQLMAAETPTPVHDHAVVEKPAEKSTSSRPSFKDTLEKPDAVWFAKAVADYPLTTCVVTGDKLERTTMTPQDFVFKQEGQPDRLIRFCCGDCKTDFLKDPAKYLKLIDDAAAAKTKAVK